MTASVAKFQRLYLTLYRYRRPFVLQARADDRVERHRGDPQQWGRHLEAGRCRGTGHGLRRGALRQCAGKHLLRLSGRQGSPEDRIVYTGLRPGEKLHEELAADARQVGNEGLATVPHTVEHVTHVHASYVCSLKGWIRGSSRPDAVLAGYETRA